MSCHIVTSAGMRSFCGLEKFGDHDDGSYHSYVEVLGRRLYMANCKKCLKEYHRQELENLDE